MCFSSSHFCNKAGEGGFQKRSAEGLGGYAGRGVGGIARVRIDQNSLSVEGLVDNRNPGFVGTLP